MPKKLLIVLIDHLFIENVLVRFDVDPMFIRIFKVLYNDLSAKILINGYFTESFHIQRSVKQGDALSCILFIMCMEVVIKKIIYTTLVKSINLNSTLITKVLAYADDIAILTTNPESIKNSIDIYNEFSKYSGLHLNVDKTEILKLHGEADDIYLSNSDTVYTIRCLDKLKICGKSFSLSPEFEFEDNVNDKICKMEKMLEQWKARSISIFGRNLILKTFGLWGRVLSGWVLFRKWSLAVLSHQGGSLAVGSHLKCTWGSSLFKKGPRLSCFFQKGS